MTGSFLPGTRSSTKVSLLFPSTRRAARPKGPRRPLPPPSPLIVPQGVRVKSIPSGRTVSWMIPQQTLLAITPHKLTLALPVPPSINHQYATVNGRRVLSSKGRRYKAGVAQHIVAALTTSSQRKDLLKNLREHTLKFSIKFFFTSPLRRDIDGGLKIAQDAICDALEINDNRIVEIHLYKTIDATHPRMECSLSIKPSKLTPPKRKSSRNIRLPVKASSFLHLATERSDILGSHRRRKPTS